MMSDPHLTELYRTHMNGLTERIDLESRTSSDDAHHETGDTDLMVRERLSDLTLGFSGSGRYKSPEQQALVPEKENLRESYYRGYDQGLIVGYYLGSGFMVASSMLVCLGVLWYTNRKPRQRSGQDANQIK